MVKWLVVGWITLLFFVVGALFYFNQLAYLLPTPVPRSYRQVNQGRQIELPAHLGENTLQPVFLHFFNPDCPCSRFNKTQFIALYKKYHAKVNFAVVVLSKKTYTVLYGYRFTVLE